MAHTVTVRHVAGEHFAVDIRGHLLADSAAVPAMTPLNADAAAILKHAGPAVAAVREGSK